MTRTKKNKKMYKKGKAAQASSKMSAMPDDRPSAVTNDRPSTVPLKYRRRTALIYLVIMAAFLIYSLSSGADSSPWLVLSAAIIAAVFIFNMTVGRFAKIPAIILVIISPAAIFMLTELYTHDMDQMWRGPVFFNLLFYYLIFAVLLFICGRAGLALRIQAIVMACIGAANYFTILFRSIPIFPWDLYSLKVAGSVANNFRYTLSIRALNVVLLFIALNAVCGKLRLRISRKSLRLAGSAAGIAVFFLLCRGVQTDAAASQFKFDTTLFTAKIYYRDNGFLLSFIVNMRYLNIDKPGGYSVDAASGIAKEVSAENPDSGKSVDITKKPNIIVIMNEAFSDLSILGDYKTNTEVMPFIDSLSKNTIKGWYYSSVKGGNTANTELEFLTGSSLYWLPVGSIAYQQYIRSTLPAMSSRLSSLGYTSIAMHPYYSSGWNRDKVYDYMGFDEKYFINDFVDPEILRLYISDQATYNKIIDRYEAKDANERLFVFDVTMQNHGSYWRHYDNFTPDVSIIGGSGTYLSSTEQYLSLIKRSDQAFENLVDYFKDADEPTIILMFGDHQPADYVVDAVEDIKENDLQNQQLRYKVPYVMWANYDIQESTDDVTSANYLGVKLMEAAGIPLTDYQYFLKQLSAQVPVITANMAIDSSGTFHKRGDSALADILRQYSIMQYNDLADCKNRIESFFN